MKTVKRKREKAKDIVKDRDEKQSKLQLTLNKEWTSRERERERMNIYLCYSTERDIVKEKV